MLRKKLKKWKVAIESSIVVVALVIVKLLIEHFGLEFITLNSLFTSIIGGGIFLFSLILAGTLADYKESERIPSEIVAACENIYHEGRYVKQTRQDFNLDKLISTLVEIVSGFRSDVAREGSRKCLRALTKLPDSFLEMETLGVPPNYIARLKSEEGLIRKNLLRMYYIQRINFLPSAYVLVQSIVGLIVVLLMLTKIEPFYDSVIIIIFLSYLFVYIIKLLRTLDKPFRPDGTTMDDVSLFLLEEFGHRVAGHHDSRKAEAQR